MNKHADGIKNDAIPVDAEVVQENVRHHLPSSSSVTGDIRQGPTPYFTFFHPLSGLAILGVDLVAFGMNAPTGLVLTPVICILSFLITFLAVYKIQRHQTKDKPGSALLKGFLGGIAAGLPLPIAGTFLGVAILTLSGLPIPQTGMWRRYHRFEGSR